MKKDFYQKERIFHIYLIRDPYTDATYIGKTCDRDPRARFRAHLRGECLLTSDDFLFEAIDSEKIEWRLLESLVCTGSTAYRHVVAWCRFFEDRGALLLNAAGTVQDSEHLHPKTQAIYDAVCEPFSADEVLTREVVPLQREPDSAPYESPLCSLSMRVPEDTREVFHAFCEQHALTQKDALRLLLLTQEELDCERLAKAIQAELAEKDSQIAELEASLEKKRAHIQRMRDRNAIIVETCQRYARGAISHLPAPESPRLRAVSFKTAKRTIDFAAYSYPTSSGCDHFTPEHLVYGKGVAAPLFVLGRNIHGDKIKLRWYDRDSYVGSTFKRSAYAHKGAFWLVGYAAAGDGAVDLVAALPLSEVETTALRKSSPDSQPMMNPNLDDIIKAAEGKKKP